MMADPFSCSSNSAFGVSFFEKITLFNIIIIMANKKQESKKVTGAKKSPTKTSAKKGGRLEDLNFADGLNKDIEKIKDLERVLGINEMNPYKTRNSEVFDETLSGMNLSDLQELAVRVGVFPSGTKASLKQKLRKQFVADNRGGGGVGVMTPKQKTLDPNNPKHAETIRLMREGL